MPLSQDLKVNFTTTLFALIRENLSIKIRPSEFIFFFFSLDAFGYSVVL